MDSGVESTTFQVIKGKGKQLRSNIVGVGRKIASIGRKRSYRKLSRKSQQQISLSADDLSPIMHHADKPGRSEPGVAQKLTRQKSELEKNHKDEALKVEESLRAVHSDAFVDYIKSLEPLPGYSLHDMYIATVEQAIKDFTHQYSSETIEKMRTKRNGSLGTEFEEEIVRRHIVPSGSDIGPYVKDLQPPQETEADKPLDTNKSDQSCPPEQIPRVWDSQSQSGSRHIDPTGDRSSSISPKATIHKHGVERRRTESSFCLPLASQQGRQGNVGLDRSLGSQHSDLDPCPSNQSAKEYASASSSVPLLPLMASEDPAAPETETDETSDAVSLGSPLYLDISPEVLGRYCDFGDDFDMSDTGRMSHDGSS